MKLRYVIWVILVAIIGLLTVREFASAQTLQDYYNTGGDTAETFGTATGTKWEYQTFTATSDYDLEIVKVEIQKTGSPADVEVRIRATSGNVPTGSDLAVETIPAGDVGASFAFEIANFSPTVALTNGTKYAIILSCSGCTGSNYYEWNWDESAPSYASNNAGVSTDSGSTWTAYTSIDGMFEVWGTASAGGGGTSTPTSTATTTVYTIDNPSQNVANGLYLFFIVFFGLLFYFRKGVR